MDWGFSVKPSSLYFTEGLDPTMIMRNTVSVLPKPYGHDMMSIRQTIGLRFSPIYDELMIERIPTTTKEVQDTDDRRIQEFFPTSL